MNEKIKLRRTQVMFSRLFELAEEQRKQLKENPEPFLSQAYREVSTRRAQIEEACAVLRGLDDLIPGNQDCFRIESIEAVQRRRIEKAIKVLKRQPERGGGE